MQPTKLKGTLDELRDMPTYPHRVAEIIAGLNLVIAIFQGIVGVTFITQTELLLNIITLVGLIGNSVFDTNIAVYKYWFGRVIDGRGLFLVIQALARLYIALGIYLKWPGMLLSTAAFSAWSLYTWLQSPRGIITYIAILLLGMSVVLLLFDKRLQAYFGRGPLANQYWMWIYDRERGRAVTASPWEYQTPGSTTL